MKGNDKLMFDIPVCLIIFKRSDTAVRIIRRISEVKPRKLYLIGDAGRNDEENALVESARKAVESAVDWDCELIKYYAEENRGVYENIAGGAKWVFQREKKAIFLEDDNLPAVSFFDYCKEMLERYENDDRILWVCGTNYLEKYSSKNDVSYMFTQHLLPCGWASWAEKFPRMYDGDLKGMDEPDYRKKLRQKYDSKKLYEQQLYTFRREQHRRIAGKKYRSWDYQMAFSLRYYDKMGISPQYNQIENIGVDQFSEHGGNSFKKEMTRRFCGIPTHELSFPLKHPETVEVDVAYEKKISEIITNPLSVRIKHKLKCFCFRMVGLDDTLTFAEGKKELKKHRK